LIPGASRAPRAGRAPLALLALSHAVIDTYGAFLAPIVALVLAPRLGFSEAAAARLLALYTGVLSLGQVGFGYFSDRGSGRQLAVASPAVAGLAAGGYLLAPSLPWLVVLALATAVAVAAYHPEAVALAGAVGATRERSAATATAWFLAAGPVGLTVGPLLVTWAARRPSPPVWLPVLGVAATALLAWSLRGARDGKSRAGEVAAGRKGGVWARVRPHRRVLSRLAGISALRYLTLTALTFGVPLLLADHLPVERAVAVSGWWLSLFLGAGALGGIVGSALTERLAGRPGAGGRSANAWSLAAAAPLVALLPHLPLSWGWLPLTAVGLALGWGTPILVALGQRVAPGAAAFVSALLMGGAWSLGGPAAPVLFEGLRAGYSSAVAMGVLGVACLAGAWLAWRLPRDLDGPPEAPAA
jgi:MFS transporter, FSR family, fosmidomycin resistance protein